ncbi:hypothetical protein [Plasmodium yoelii yoelii]|uniref:Uncharacterized protein n=1 Tax=Plasmodium yoelii yoelii TaxID=73239 RepID=Q7RLE8_PLAYO|nr:hypothetical protein [Plasmodium yoelii yoelii]
MCLFCNLSCVLTCEFKRISNLNIHYFFIFLFFYFFTFLLLSYWLISDEEVYMDYKSISDYEKDENFMKDRMEALKNMEKYGKSYSEIF